MVTRMEFHARSITIFATAANCSFFFTYSRIFRSLCKNAGNSCGEAYQRERQSRFTFRRKPIGLTFCPIPYVDCFLLFGARFADFWSGAVAAPCVAAPASSFFAAFFSAFCFAFRVSLVSIAITSVSTMRMWLVRFRIRLALPRARAMIRFNVGPSPTVASFTTKPSGLRFALFSALAIALFSVLPMRNAAFLGVKASKSSAAETGRPWISRVTSRTLKGEIRAYLYVDLTSIASCPLQKLHRYNGYIGCVGDIPSSLQLL